MRHSAARRPLRRSVNPTVTNPPRSSAYLGLRHTICVLVLEFGATTTASNSPSTRRGSAPPRGGPPPSRQPHPTPVPSSDSPHQPIDRPNDNPLVERVMSAIEITTTTRANAPVPRASSRGLRNRLDAPMSPSRALAPNASSRVTDRRHASSRVTLRRLTSRARSSSTSRAMGTARNGERSIAVIFRFHDARASWRLFSAACAGSPCSCRTCETVAIRCARGRRARERRRRGSASEIFRWTSRVTKGRARARVRAREGTRRRDARGNV